jgi:hypothetical protein
MLVIGLMHDHCKTLHATINEIRCIKFLILCYFIHFVHLMRCSMNFSVDLRDNYEQTVLLLHFHSLVDWILLSKGVLAN